VNLYYTSIDLYVHVSLKSTILLHEGISELILTSLFCY